MAVGHFLNVDLDIESAADLRPLAAELEAVCVILHASTTWRGRNRLSLVRLESLECDNADGPDAVIHDLCGIIEALSPAGRALWYSATVRQFDVGYDAQPTPGHPAARFILRPDTIGRVARLGATLAMTVYPPDPAC
jgi:hypothetical protein